MAYKFITVKGQVKALAEGGNLSLNPDDVWGSIRIDASYRKSRLMVCYDTYPTKPIGVVYFHLFSRCDVCIVEYIQAINKEVAQELMDELRRRVFIMYNVAGSMPRIVRLIHSGADHGIANNCIHMRTLYTYECGETSLKVCADYIKLHAQDIMRTLYLMYRYVWKEKNPWSIYAFSNAIGDLITGPTYHKSE